MRKTLTVAVIGLLCLGGAANAEGSPEALVKARQAGMILSGSVLGGIKAATDAGQAPSTQRGATRAFARWAHTLPDLFPDDTADVESGAQPTVWSDRAGFTAQAAEFAAAADRLSELSAGDDAAAFTTQLATVRSGCQSCHAVYKQ